MNFKFRLNDETHWRWGGVNAGRGVSCTESVQRSHDYELQEDYRLMMIMIVRRKVRHAAPLDGRIRA